MHISSTVYYCVLGYHTVRAIHCIINAACSIDKPLLVMHVKYVTIGSRKR